MAALARGHALPAVEFSEVAIAGSGMQATSNSGLRVYTQLPTFNDTDLEETCPGSSNLKIRNIPAVTGTTDDKDKDTLEGWAIGLLSGLAVLALGTAVALMIMVSREKSGNPIFVPIKDGATTA